jgi:hypothetical protein
MSISASYQENKFKVMESTAVKSDLEPNAFRNLILASKANLWKHVEMVQYNTENQRSGLSHIWGTYQYSGHEIRQ